MTPGKAEPKHDYEAADGFRCTTCGFTLDASNGGYLYVKNVNGTRMALKGKDEQAAIARILLGDEFSLHGGDPGQFDEDIDMMEERVGYMSACICMNCLDQFGLDLRKDTLECPGCRSDHVRTFLEITDKRCPKCQSGQMEKMGYRL